MLIAAVFSLCVGNVASMAFLESNFPFPNVFPPVLNVSELRSVDRAVVPVAPEINNWQFRQHQIGLSHDSELHLAPSHDRGTSSCGATITNLALGDTGYIRSPLYPENYPPDIKCVWWLKALDGLKISMTCTDVLTQTCDAGYFDYVLVAPDWAWIKYYLLCGDYNKYTPFTLISTENFMSVYFRTSLQQHYRGFQCRYEVIVDKTTTTTAPTAITTTTTPAKTVQYNGEEGCGIPNTAARIVGGTQVPPHSYPWMVGLSFNGQWFCGGTLLNKDWVLTAAHCTYGAVSSYVYLGAHNLYIEENGRIIVFSQNFVIHPEYNAEKIANDVALVKLPANSVPAYTDYIRPACLPVKSAKDTDLTGVEMKAVGWGKTENSSTISPVLNQLSVTLVSNSICAKSYGDIIRDTNVCAQGKNGTGTCQGDSGSSLQYSPRSGLMIQFGIVSFGASTGCGTGYPNGFSRVSSYLDFIGKTIGKNFN